MTTIAEIISLLPTTSGTTSQATGINQYGVVIGNETTSTGASQGFMVSNGAVTLLTPTPSYAGGINSYDEVAGWSGSNFSAEDWFYGSFASNTLPGGMDGSGNAINDSDAIGGEAFTNGSFQAFVLSKGTVNWLGALNGATTTGTELSRVNGLNNSTVAVGSSAYQSGATGIHAFSWQNGTMTDLGTLPGGSNSEATAINNSGVIVGWSDNASLWDHAVVWQNGVITDLGGLSGYSASEAWGINDNGQIVGYSSGGGVQHAVLWQNGTVTDLNSLLPVNSGWVLQDAVGINDNGLIVGYGLYDGVQTAFEMSLNGLTAPLHTVQAVSQLYNSGQTIPQQSVIDSSANISQNIDLLQSMSGSLSSIGFSDTSPVLAITASQFVNDAAAIAEMTGSFSLLLDANTPNVTLTGPTGETTRIQLDGPASAYSITAIDGGTGFKVVGAGSTDIFHNVAGMTFADGAQLYTGALGAVTIQSLGTLSAGNPNSSNINNAGIIVGTAGASSVPIGAVAFAWSDSGAVNGTLTSLPALSGATGTEAFHINDNGLVVGESYKGNSVGTGSSTAVYWSYAGANGGTPSAVSIGWLPGDFASVAAADNDQGAIVGLSYTTGTDFNGFLWQNGSMINIGSLGGGQVEPLSINNSNIITGKATTAGGNYHAFVWQNGVMTDLGTLTGGTISAGEAVNDSGVIAGYSTDSTGNDQAVLWTNGKMQELPNLSGCIASFANAENNKGWVVGEASTATGADAVLWANGGIYNLNSFLPISSGWILGDATGVNDNGQITGYGTYNGQTASFEITLPSSLFLTAYYAIEEFGKGQLTGPTAISDSAANVASNIDGLQTLSAAGDLGGITLTDSGTPSLTISATQLTADAAVLQDISSPYSLTVLAGSTSVSVAGPSGHATTVSFTGAASQYTVTSADGVLTVSGNGATDQLTNVAALQFADFSEIVAAAPGSTNVTTGNVTELYSAVLGREPDVSGLAFYQTYLKANPNTPLLQFAEWFLTSTEYTSAHNYAQTTAGETQFITDSYQNLLHRTAAASDISFYLTNVIQPALANLTPGTQAYAAADLQAHAQMLVYFSASSEFLGDVQVTAAHPADSQHWLILT